MKRSLRRPVHAPLALALLLASGAASALGLGQIELKSKIGEPLVAEIPIISSDPSELEQLRAGMPSRETFARIGLQEPDALVSSLRYTSALDARGRPVIRVTSDQPINEPLLNFLVEVDWGQGRLVREYSALIAPPRTVAAPMQPPIEAPQAAPSNAIVREPVAPPAPVVRPTPPPAPAARPTPPPGAAAPAPTPARSVPAAPTPVRAATPADTTVRVRAGQSLSEIASSVRGEVSLQQAMVALLRANPDAFIDGDINQLKRGAVLRVPARTDMGSVDAGEAGELVRTQVERWQLARRPVPTPDAPAPQPTAATPAAPSAGPASATTAAVPAAPARVSARNRARLEIVPPGASNARQAGTQSGLAATGGGQMLRQELEQAQEAVAARDVELAEMKARVAELEALQKQQSQLITLKDSELAAAQQRLAQAQQAAPDAAAPALWPWALGTLLAVVIGLLLVWLSRRRAAGRAFAAPGATSTASVRSAPVAPPRAAPPSRPSLADAFADGVAPVPRDLPARADAGPTPTDAAAPAAAMAAPAAIVASDARSTRGKGRGARAKARAHVEPAMPAPAEDSTPTATTPDVEPAAAPASEPTRAAASPDAPMPITPAVFATPAPASAAPTWHATTRAGVASRSTPAPPAPASAATQVGGAASDGSGNERLELARAYLDLGDQASARQLLVELVVNGDEASRQQASRLLRDLD